MNSSTNDLQITEIINRTFHDYDSNPYLINRRILRFVSRKGRLSFYPLSKNLRMLATSYSKSLGEGTSFRISNRPRRGEEKFVRSALGWESWFPWVWVRHLQEDPRHLSGAWLTYFDSTLSGADTSTGRKRVLRNLKPIELVASKFVLYCEALSRLFKLSQYSKAYVSSNLDIELLRTPFLALHIRRGENVSIDNTWIRPGFTFVSIEEYLDSVDILAAKLQLNRIYLACDSALDMNEVKQRLQGRYEIFYLDLDRSRFVRHTQGHIEDVETWCQKNHSDIPFYTLSGIAELYAFSNCSGFVGSIGSSEFAKTGWLLACSKSRKVVPYISLGSTFDFSDPSFFEMS